MLRRGGAGVLVGFPLYTDDGSIPPFRVKGRPCSNGLIASSFASQPWLRWRYSLPSWVRLRMPTPTDCPRPRLPRISKSKKAMSFAATA